MSNETLASESNRTIIDEEAQEQTRESSRQRSRRNEIIAASLVTTVVVALALLAWVLTRGGAQSIQTQNAPPAHTATTSAAAGTPVVTVTKVVMQDLERQLRLPGELQAYQEVALYPRVQGFVEAITVDRGSAVKRGQLLVRMSAPELGAQRGEAESKTRGAAQSRLEMESRMQSVRAQRLEAEAKLAADEGYYKRLKAASETPGVVAQNDVDVAAQSVEADRARVRSFAENEKAAQAQVRLQAENEKGAREAARSVQDVQSYLRITAPFDGVITERNAHQGSLAGPPSSASAPPLLRLQQIFQLR
nr:efflux RND transporter periplasmic adaptor subunit [Pyrinomonadaceae bacterium]